MTDSTRALYYRRGKQVILLCGVVWLIACVAIVLSAAWDDHKIDSHPGQATATVLSITSGGIKGGRTYVSYQTRQGEVIEPQAGVKYPTGLEVGQRVRVEYNTQDTELVKVAGRSWTLSIIPALSSWVVGTFILWLVLKLVDYLQARGDKKREDKQRAEAQEQKQE